jgi:hypothetical protein
MFECNEGQKDGENSGVVYGAHLLLVCETTNGRSKTGFDSPPPNAEGFVI